MLSARLSSFKIDKKRVQELAAVICSQLGLGPVYLCIKFVPSKEMTRINKQFRNIEKDTDVLSFPQIDWLAEEKSIRCVGLEPMPKLGAEGPLGCILGDLVISPEKAFENAQTIGHALDRELAFLLIHGILHLCGHDHEKPEEEKRMLEQQTLLLSFLEESRGRPLWTDCLQLK